MTSQSDKWHATRKARTEELLSLKYEVVEEFKDNEPRKTPLGYTVKNGWVLETADGANRIAVGKALLNTLAEAGAVEKPVAKKRGRPRKEEPLKQAEQWASRQLPDDAQQITQAGPTYTNPNSEESL